MTITVSEIIALVSLFAGAVFWLARLETAVRVNTKDITGVAKSLRERVDGVRSDHRLQRTEDLGRIEKTLDEIKAAIDRLGVRRDR